jgi:hypothetical protein
MKRFSQILLIVTFIPFCWLAMQVVHELGHVLIAAVTGGEVTKVVLHPLVISRTDLADNPRPLAVVWAGPLLGSLLPLCLFAAARLFRTPGVYLFRFFAGFCLVANGIYIGIGHMLADGADPDVMMENGSPRWLLILFGAVAFPAGLYLWHRQGHYFGLGVAKGRGEPRMAFVTLSLFLCLVAWELIRGVK